MGIIFLLIIPWFYRGGSIVSGFRVYFIGVSSLFYRGFESILGFSRLKMMQPVTYRGVRAVARLLLSLLP